MNTTSMTWETVERGFNPRKKECFISIRSASILVNSVFYRQIEGPRHNYRYIQLRRNNEHHCLLLEFLTPEQYQKRLNANKFEDGIFELLQDGGAKNDKKKNSWVIGCGRLIQRTPWLKAIAGEIASKKRRFVPIETEKPNAFIVQCMPSFENEASAHFCNVHADVKGIYCYESASGEILYIGQGVIKSRFKEHRSQKDIPAKLFKWTVVDDDAKRLQAESHHINAFVAKHGRLPLYNRVAGHKDG